MNGWPCRACGTRARTDRGQRSEKSFRVNGPAGAGRSGSSPVSAVSAPFGQSKADPRVVVSPKSENNSNTSTPRTEKLPRHYASPSPFPLAGRRNLQQPPPGPASRRRWRPSRGASGDPSPPTPSTASSSCSRAGSSRRSATAPSSSTSAAPTSSTTHGSTGYARTLVSWAPFGAAVA
jgi:hypothetical protein